jgi:hypothetical protein
MEVRVVAQESGQGPGLGLEGPFDGAGAAGRPGEPIAPNRGCPATAFPALTICSPVPRRVRRAPLGPVLVVDDPVAAASPDRALAGRVDHVRLRHGRHIRKLAEAGSA